MAKLAGLLVLALISHLQIMLNDCCASSSEFQQQQQRQVGGDKILQIDSNNDKNIAVGAQPSRNNFTAQSNDNNNINKQSIIKSGSKRGQLESFNLASVGLGDLEASDVIKTVNKRSTFGAGNGGSGRALAGWRLNKRLQAVGQGEPRADRSRPVLALQRLPAGDGASNQQIAPILLARRTDELLDSPVLAIELADDGQPGDGAGKSPLMGEFGSRISLLTTRKVEPFDAEQQQVTQGVPFWSDEVLIGELRQPALEQPQQQQEALNYLPRIARANNM